MGFGIICDANLHIEIIVYIVYMYVQRYYYLVGVGVRIYII